MTERRSPVNTTSEPVTIGSVPPVGRVPRKMHAQVVRQSRYGAPQAAFAGEVVDVPPIGPDEVLIAVMAAGINYNNVWAARGYPVDQIAAHQKAGEPFDFHVGGSDLSGVVYATGDDVTDVHVGDQVVVHHGVWSTGDSWVESGNDPMLAPSARIWGYDTNFGSFGQFSRAQAHQVLPKAPHLTWEEAAAPTRVDDHGGQKAWSTSARAFGKRIWEIIGERRDPAIVFEHPGQSTVPTSIFVCEQGGMVVICAGTTGYDAVVDLRYHWTKQKRFQGSHGTNDEQAGAYNDLVCSGAIDPCLGRVMSFDEIPAAHETMANGVAVFGNVVAVIVAPAPGAGRTA